MDKAPRVLDLYVANICRTAADLTALLHTQALDSEYSARLPFSLNQDNSDWIEVTADELKTTRDTLLKMADSSHYICAMDFLSANHKSI